MRTQFSGLSLCLAKALDIAHQISGGGERRGSVWSNAPILRAVLRLAVSRVRIVHSVVIPDPVK